MRVDRLTLGDFRNHQDLVVTLPPALPGEGDLILISGENGTGKTNILEAVSLLAPGRGLRGARLSAMARIGGPGGFTIAARLSDDDSIAIGTGTIADAPERRRVRINGAEASVAALGEWVSVLWLTPAMDRLFTAAPGDRRKFFDRLVLAIEPGHARTAARYERALRERTQLLTTGAADPIWLTSIEESLAETGAALAKSRARVVQTLGRRLAEQPESAFARAELSILPVEDGEEGRAPGDAWASAEGLARQFRAMRARDAAAGRALGGPHRYDLKVMHADKGVAADRSSTGEQKALLIGIVLAHAALVTDLSGRRPLLLLDEVAAHLDPPRRAALFDRLNALGCQSWLTATEAHFFAESGNDTARFTLAQKGRDVVMSPM